VILGDFRKWSEDKWLYAERLAQHMDYLSTRTFDEIEDGVYPVGEDGTYLVVKTTDTIPFSEALPERHQRYMDIHYILAGSETIGFARECEKNQSLEVTPVIDDHIFFQAVEHEMALTLYPGQYAIFLPDDIHRPWCTGTETNYVRKALLKVPVPEK
jgi:biofilm protein TabA